MKTRLIAMATLCMPALSFAAGVFISPERLPAEARAALVAEIAQAKLDAPQGFHFLAELRGRLPTIDAQKRGGLVPLGHPIATQGQAVVLPIIEMLAFTAEPRGDLTDSAWRAWRIGLLEALAELGNVKAEPVLVAILQTERDAQMIRVAAGALGSTQSTFAASYLVTALSSPAVSEAHRAALAAGAGACRRASVALALAKIAGARPSTELAQATARALGRIGNRTAWKYGAKLPVNESEEVRLTAAKALVDLYVTYTGETRAAASRALMVIDHPQTPQLIAAASTSADPSQRDALVKLQARFDNNPAR